MLRPSPFIIFLYATLMISFFLCCTFDMYAQSSTSRVSWDDVLQQERAWYGSEEAIHIADNVLIYQHDLGGWPKNTDMAEPLTESEIQSIQNELAKSDLTIDNGATLTQMRLLALVFEVTGHDRFKEGFENGLEYLLEAQYENGGWPQYYPLRDGYYSHITFNDGAMIEVMRLLSDIVEGDTAYAFANPDLRRRSSRAMEKGLDVILQTQIKVEGNLTAWCAQYDPETLEPADARSYELVSISGGESVGIVRYLMEIENPDDQVIQSIESAVQWFEKVKLRDIRLLQLDKPSLPNGYDRVVAFDPEGATPMWARFYEIGTNYPMFVDREGTVHYAFSELPYERRVGYSWLGTWPYELLQEDYQAWKGQIE